jgi:NAD+ synthase (glutamine-hydrolysing)
MNFKVTLAQTDSILGNINKNIIQHCEIIEKAIDQGSDMIVFPELSLTGYVLRDLNYDLALNPRTTSLLDPIKNLSKYIDIICGTVEEGEEFGMYNSALYYSNGEFKDLHRKIYLPTYGLFEEERYFSPGRDLHTIDTKFGKMGILICEDFWHLSLPYILAKKGAFMIVGLSSSPTRIAPNEDKFKQNEINNEFHKVYARLLSLYIAWCNRVGFEEGLNYWGGSEIISPNGEVIQKAALFKPDTITGTMNTNDIKRSRMYSKHFVDDDINFTINELNKIRSLER